MACEALPPSPLYVYPRAWQDIADIALEILRAALGWSMQAVRKPSEAATSALARPFDDEQPSTPPPPSLRLHSCVPAEAVASLSAAFAPAMNVSPRARSCPYPDAVASPSTMQSEAAPTVLLQILEIFRECSTRFVYCRQAAFCPRPACCQHAMKTSAGCCRGALRRRLIEANILTMVSTLYLVPPTIRGTDHL